MPRLSHFDVLICYWPLGLLCVVLTYAIPDKTRLACPSSYGAAVLGVTVRTVGSHVQFADVYMQLMACLKLPDRRLWDVMTQNCSDAK